MAIKIKNELEMKISLILLSIILLTCTAVAQCAENWDCLAWQRCINGVSQRACFDLNECHSLEARPAETALCSEVLPYCYDRQINQDETDIDCGGRICDKCALGKACLRDEDCSEGACIKNICSLETQQASAIPAQPAVNYQLEIIAIILLAAAVIAVAILIMKKLKKQKIHVLSGKEETKERIKIISPKPEMTEQKKKKTKINKFVENFNGYISSIKPEPKKEAKKEQKDLLNKNPYKKQANHPVKEFMLSNIKEVYEE